MGILPCRRTRAGGDSMITLLNEKYNETTGTNDCKETYLKMEYIDYIGGSLPLIISTRLRPGKESGGLAIFLDRKTVNQLKKLFKKMDDN
jgi:hypothetical protein